MGAIKRFYAPWMGLKALTMVVVEKQYPWALNHG
jgi:hypothetical protein